MGWRWIVLMVAGVGLTAFLLHRATLHAPAAQVERIARAQTDRDREPLARQFGTRQRGARTLPLIDGPRFVARQTTIGEIGELMQRAHAQDPHARYELAMLERQCSGLVELTQQAEDAASRVDTSDAMLEAMAARAAEVEALCGGYEGSARQGWNLLREAAAQRHVGAMLEYYRQPPQWLLDLSTPGRAALEHIDALLAWKQESADLLAELARTGQPEALSAMAEAFDAGTRFDPDPALALALYRAAQLRPGSDVAGIQARIDALLARGEVDPARVAAAEREIAAYLDEEG